jgi:predicted enzyme related to lactoylglutathione lyase
MDKVTHFEIPVDDMSRAKDFYKKIFGWEINDIPEMEYSLVTTVPTDEKNMPKETGAINGGMLKKDDTSTSPVIVIDVSSLDEYLKKIESAGGKVVLPKVEVGDFGLYARITDTEGNIIGIWQNIKSG